MHPTQLQFIIKIIYVSHDNSCFILNWLHFNFNAVLSAPWMLTRDSSRTTRYQFDTFEVGKLRAVSCHCETMTDIFDSLNLFLSTHFLFNLKCTMRSNSTINGLENSKWLYNCDCQDRDPNLPSACARILSNRGVVQAHSSWCLTVCVARMRMN